MKEFRGKDELGRELVYYGQDFFDYETAAQYGTPLHTPDINLGDGPLAVAVHNALTGLGIRTFGDWIANQHAVQGAIFRAIKPLIVNGLKEVS